MECYGEASISSVVLIADNHKTPCNSLLQRLRTREMMELSALRWGSAPAAGAGVSAHDLSISSSPTKSPVNSPVNRGPTAPRRQISPPAVKRGPTQLPTLSSPASSPASNKKCGRPNLPVRSKSPLVQPRYPLVNDDQDEGERQQELLEPSIPQPPALPLSPMVRSRHHNRSMESSSATQHQPRIPKRRSSLIGPAREEAEIHRILRKDSDAEDDESGGHRRNRDTSLRWDASRTEAEGGHSQPLMCPSKQPDLPTRQSSFEVLPATTPTPQSRQSGPTNQGRAVAQDMTDLNKVQASPTTVIQTPSSSVSLSKPDLGHATSAGSTKDQCPSTPQCARVLIPQGSPNSISSCESTSSSKTSRQRRFRRFRSGTRPSLPVRTSSFDMHALTQAKQSKKVGMLPGRQSSFSGLRTTFQHL